MSTSNQTPGVIEATAVYTLDEARRRLRLGAHAWRTARASGLPVRRVNGRGFVLGRDIADWLASIPADCLKA